MATLTGTIEVATNDGRSISRSISEQIESPLLDLLIGGGEEQSVSPDVESTRARVAELRATKDLHRDDVRSYRKAKNKQEREPFRPGFNAYRKAHQELKALGVPT